MTFSPLFLCHLLRSQRAKTEAAERQAETAASAFLSEQRARYASRGASAKDKAGKAKREEQTLALLNRFKSKLSATAGKSSEPAEPAPEAAKTKPEVSNDPTSLDDVDDVIDDSW